MIDDIEDISGEEWKPIDGTGQKYYISNKGRAKSLKRSKAIILAQQKNNKGYYRVCLSINGKSQYYLTHRLVADAFVYNDNPQEKDTIDHIDENKENNNSNNLQWLSMADNIRKHFELKKGKK